MSTELIKRKRNRGNANKRLNEAEESLILNYLLDLAPKNKEFEKPNKNEFYKKITEELGLEVSDSSQTKNKVKNLRKSYVNAVDWKSNTGQGVESGTVEGRVKQMCPHFDTLEEIFGHKTNVVTPYIYESRLHNDQEMETDAINVNGDVNKNRLYDDDNMKAADVSTNGCVDRGNLDLPVDEEHLDDVDDAGEYKFDEAIGTYVRVSDNRETVETGDECTEDSASASVSDKSKFQKNLMTAPSKSTPKTSFKSSEKVDKENVSQFKKRLLNSPVADNDKNMSRNSSSILADAQNKKAEAILGRNDIEKIRAENEKLFKLEEVSLAKEKFYFEKETRKSDLELRQMEIEQRNKEIESRERIEMYRIDVEAKNNLEIAKLRLQNL